MEVDFPKNNLALYSQIEDEYGKVMYTYTTQVVHAGRLHKKNNILKWVQMVLSAISTGGFIGTLITNQAMLTWLGGICSTAMLVLTAYFKDTNLSSIHKRHLDTANQLWLLRELYLSLLVDFSVLSREEVISKRDELQQRVAKVYNDAPLTDEKSYAIAQKMLKEKEAQFFTQEELNKILPESLRKSLQSK